MLTVYGIETLQLLRKQYGISVRLQQCLPFTVLKLFKSITFLSNASQDVATVLTVYGIETVRRITSLLPI